MAWHLIMMVEIKEPRKEGGVIYTDGVHLVADELQELHTFAQSVGLKRQWFQEHPRHPHYDITTPGMLKAILSTNIVATISTKALLKMKRRIA